MRWTDPAALGWLGIAVAAAAALVVNALVSAAESRAPVGAVIPVLHWLFTLVPALLAGAVTVRRGGAAPGVAALGTGVVTVPLFGLGWAQLVSREYSPDALTGSLWTTALLGALPLAVGVASVVGRGRRREVEADEPV
jgi:hypothetical protein